MATILKFLELMHATHCEIAVIVAVSAAGVFLILYIVPDVQDSTAFSFGFTAAVAAVTLGLSRLRHRHAKGGGSHVEGAGPRDPDRDLAGRGRRGAGRPR